MQKIKHLFSRGGFGLSAVEWEHKKDWSVSQAVEYLFHKASFAADLPEMEYQVIQPGQNGAEQMKEARKIDRQTVFQFAADWITRMAKPEESALLERMSLFWHGHFACHIRSSRLSHQYLSVIRQHALGNFRDLVLGIARDPAMIRFLNNQQNKKKKPNENFARELMELFTIGRGNYTEKDIKEAARAFTGWSSNMNGEFTFRAFHHDYGSKSFMGKQGNFDGTDIIDIILERKETAYFLVTKIYKYFVNEQVGEARISQLAEQFYQSDYHIGQLMKTIFESDWFYEEKNIGNKFKSPIELVAGIMRQLNVEFEQFASLLFLQRSLGQMIFNPPNVAGWPGGKTWIDNSSLFLRLNLGAYLLTNADVNFRDKEGLKGVAVGSASRRLKAEINLGSLESQTAGLNSADLFEFLKQFLIGSSAQVDNRIFENLLLDTTSDRDRLHKGLIYFLSLPEYQLC